MKYTEFFARDSKVVSKQLLGMDLVRTFGGSEDKRATIAMASAYNGEAGRPQKGLLYAPGELYLPWFSGFRKLAIGSDKENKPSVITIDAIVTPSGNVLTSSKICDYFRLGKNSDKELVVNYKKSAPSIYVIGESGNSIKEVDEKRASNCVGQWSLKVLDALRGISPKGKTKKKEKLKLLQKYMEA
ncbi:hypothetical protein ACFLZZ_02920 [Nanoarchaeota archaeon]